MAGADLIVRIDGDPSGFDRAAKSASTSASVFAKELDRLEREQAKVNQAMTQVGAGMLGAGAAITVGVGLAVKAAVDWESAWAGVRKTVDGSDAEMAALEGELRNLAKTLPATHAEIAAVAEAAGQLGVRREDIASFTKTMVDLGETTNLTADEAATSIAQLANIMGTSADDVDNLGAALVALGNDGASTERDIIMMAQRIAGAGKTIGLTESDVLGFANALSSLGVEVEAGGTAISRVMLTIQKAVDTGGSELEGFARVAGVSADEFAASFRDRPAQAISQFVEGLGRIQREGGNTTQTMDELGFSEIRVSDALRRLSSNSDLLNDSLALGSDAWADNRALVEEAAKRYDTTASKIQVARNNLNDAAITVGESLIPALSSAADFVVDLVDAFDSLPDPVKNSIGPMALLGGGAATAGGAFLLLVPKIAETRAALETLQTSMPKAAGALSALGKAAGVAAGLFVVGTAMAAIENASLNAVPGIEATTSALLDMSEAGDVASLDALFASLRDGKDPVDSMSAAFESLTQKSWDESINDKIGGFFGEVRANDQAAEVFDNIGQSLASMVQSGNAELAAEQFQLMADRMGLTKEETEVLMGLMPAYGESLAGVANESELAAGQSGSLAAAFESTSGSIGGVTLTAEEAAEAIDALSGELDKILGRAFSVEEASDSYAESLIALTEATKDSTAETAGNSAEALRNREALRSSVEAAFGVIDAMQKQGASSEQLKGKTAELKDSLYNAARQAGFSEEAARQYAGQLDAIPGAVETVVDVATQQASAQLDAYLAKINNINGRTVTTYVNNVQRMVGAGPQTAQADGSVLDFYAGGGFSESHVAQIAPAGAWRVWAEPETGGEAYIPLSPAKRDRSVAIWEETGRRLGVMSAFADGGISGGAGGQVVAHIAKADLWTLAQAVSQLTVTMNGRAVSEQFTGQIQRGAAR